MTPPPFTHRALDRVARYAIARERSNSAAPTRPSPAMMGRSIQRVKAWFP
ncbi:hypothetical protein [Allofranklinella schreckenbergeri]|nr:hypothetical protein [Allofranklinella schreckenbergeri]